MANDWQPFNDKGATEDSSACNNAHQRQRTGRASFFFPLEQTRRELAFRLYRRQGLVLFFSPRTGVGNLLGKKGEGDLQTNVAYIKRARFRLGQWLPAPSPDLP